MGINEVVLEREDVLDVGASKSVDAVVDDDPRSDEVVRVLDVEIEDTTVEVDVLGDLDDVVAAVRCEHRPCPGRTAPAD